MYLDPTGHICEAKYNQLKAKSKNELTPQDKKDVQEYEEIFGSDIDENIRVNNEDLDRQRMLLGNPVKANGLQMDTIAVAKCNVKGLEGIQFTGASPTVLKSAKQPSLDEAYPNRKIRAPWDTKQVGQGQATRHAEEGVMAQFDEAVKNLGINSNDVKGTIYIHQSNANGVCYKCTTGLYNDTGKDGIFKQFSNKYPNLTIVATSDTRNEMRKGHGTLTFTLRNGKMSNVMKI